MYFTDRVTLGKQMAQGLDKYVGKDAVIICLDETSLLSCLSMARRLRAWVYPLVYEPIYSKNGAFTSVGAIDANGEVYFHPDTTKEVEELVYSQRESAKAAAIKKQAAYEMTLDQNVLSGRDVILACDVLVDPIPLVIARRMLDHALPKSLHVVIGNASPIVAEQVRMTADETLVLDVLSGVIADRERYFQKQDEYTIEQKRSLTKHITAYWH